MPIGILSATNFGGVRSAHSFAVAAVSLPPRKPQMKTRVNDAKELDQGRVFLFGLALACLLVLPAVVMVHAQQTNGTPGSPSGTEYKMTTTFAPGVAVPDKVETSIGTLNLNYGYPDDATTQRVYDNLDASRALQAYLLAIPIVNQASMRDSMRQFGPDNRTDVIWENLVDSKTVELTANDNTVYSFIWIDTHKGPLVVEVPPMVLGPIDDFWYKWVADIGITGADQGKGGKYLILPPSYTGEVPAGSSCVRPRTATGCRSAPSSLMARPSPVLRQ